MLACHGKYREWWESLRLEVLGRGADLLVRQSSEDICDHLVKGLFVVALELVLVLAGELLLRKIEVNRHLVVLLKLHDNEWVSRLTLPEGGVQAHAKHIV